jgi:hypothetical protein
VITNISDNSIGAFHPAKRIRNIDNMICSKLTPDNVLVTDAWRAYKTYAKEKGMKVNTLLKACITSKM